MAISGIILLLAVLALLGMSIRGLFNKSRSIPCAIAGIVVFLGAVPGALIAWGEGQSIPWTAAYVIVSLIGVTSVVRQVKL